ncbi:MAG: hypothetical protein FWF56_04835 [Firmicutes bacterium]|nr:hypothetical protein [Bacillota bacterium]MCL1954005.1 hypothetical protein [Bacillota bacterium]
MKLIKFKNDPIQLFMRACDKTEDGKYLEALDCCNRVIELITTKSKSNNFYYDVVLQMATIYTKMELYDQALNLYYSIIDVTGFSTVVSDSTDFSYLIYMGIVRCFAYKNMLEHASYYMNYAIKRKIIFDSEESNIIEFFINSGIELDEMFGLGSIVRLDEQIISNAKKEMRKDNSKKAIKMLETIKPHSESYGEACLLTTLIHIETEDINKASSKLNELIKARYNSSNIVYTHKDLFFLLTKLQLCFLKGELEVVQQLCQLIDSLDVDDYRSCRRILSNMIIVNKHDLVYKYACKVAEILPYDTQNILLVAISAYNIGLYEQSRANFVALHIIDSNDLIAKEFCNIVLEPKVGTILSYQNPIPEEPFESYIREVREIIDSPKRIKKSKALLVHKHKVEWILYGREFELAYSIASEISSDLNWLNTIKKYLISFCGDENIKGMLLHSYLCNNTNNFFKKTNKTFNINININSFLIKVYPICPISLKDMNPVFVDAYWLIFVHLLVYNGTSPFASKLYKKFESFAELMESKQFEYDDLYALCACFAYFFGDVPIFSTPKKCISEFYADEELFFLYSSYLNSQLQKLKPIKKDKQVKGKNTKLSSTASKVSKT